MKFEVDTASLSYSVQKMELELSKINETGKKLYSALTALDGMWDGPAHDTFAAQYRSDQQALENMKKTISQVIEDLKEARKAYEQCEQSVETEVRKIAV